MNTSTAPPPANGLGALGPAQAEAMIRLIEAAPNVRRRYQYFVWMQSHLKALLPHQVAVCGAWQRQQRTVVLEAFHGLPLADEVLDAMTHLEGPVLQAMLQAWLAQRGRPLSLALSSLPDALLREAAVPVIEAGLDHWLLHGVSRPSRLHELESLFLFAMPGQVHTPAHLVHAELVMPHLHSTYQRMQAFERDMGLAPLTQPHRETAPGLQITPRERQILGWVREGKSNQEIGVELGISALTVKNHVQKILRKLGAANRAQAVAKAMTLNLLNPAGGPV